MAARQNPHVPRRRWHSGESRIPRQVVQKQATVIVGSNKDAGRTNMKYITWLLLFVVLSCVFVAARNAQAAPTIVYCEAKKEDTGSRLVLIMRERIDKECLGAALETKNGVEYGCWQDFGNRVHIKWDRIKETWSLPMDIFDCYGPEEKKK